MSSVLKELITATSSALSIHSFTADASPGSSTAIASGALQVHDSVQFQIRDEDEGGGKNPKYCTAS